MLDSISFSCSITSGGATDNTAYTVLKSVRLTRYVVNVPNYTNDVTTSLKVVKSDGTTIVYTGAAHSRNATYSVPVDVELFPTDIIRLSVSGDIGAGANGVTGYLYSEE